MVTYENMCVFCASNMGCIGNACMYRNVPVLTCDECGCEVEELYEVDFDNDQRCLECLLEVVGAKKVEI